MSNNQDCGTEILENRTFQFGRIDGSVIGFITFGSHGTLLGYQNQNEYSWSFKNGELVFLDDKGVVTTVFNQFNPNAPTCTLYGEHKPHGPGAFHVLTETTESSTGLFGYPLRQAMQLVSANRNQCPRKTVSVFLVHNISTWDALHGIYEAMEKSTDFLPIVATIPLNFNHARGHVFDGEETIHAAFDEMKIPHVRFNFQDHWQGLSILKAIRPDILFRQAPWDEDIPAAYSTHQLSFTRLVYTDYGLGILNDTPDSVYVDYDLEFHRRAWMLLCANEEQKRIYETCSLHRGLRAVVTGYPKFDKLVQRGQEKSLWPINGGRRRFRLIWAPHHSVRREWLGFGTFHLVYKELLQWASDNPDVEIVLKPHPMLFESCVAGLLTKTELDNFIRTWTSLENTSLQTGGDYAPLLSASDAMLTDGISFLAEYQLFRKPLIWLDSEQHIGLNAIGESVLKGAYRVTSASEAIDLLTSLRNGNNDPLESQREETVRYLMPFPGTSSENVLATIRRGLSE